MSDCCKLWGNLLESFISEASEDWFVFHMSWQVLTTILESNFIKQLGCKSPLSEHKPLTHSETSFYFTSRSTWGDFFSFSMTTLELFKTRWASWASEHQRVSSVDPPGNHLVVSGQGRSIRWGRGPGLMSLPLDSRLLCNEDNSYEL